MIKGTHIYLIIALIVLTAVCFTKNENYILLTFCLISAGPIIIAAILTIRECGGQSVKNE